MKSLKEWWRWRKDRQIFTERLASAEDRVRQLQRYQQINSRLLGMYMNELRLAHAALRRKGKALKSLHKERMARGKP